MTTKISSATLEQIGGEIGQSNSAKSTRTEFSPPPTHNSKQFLSSKASPTWSQNVRYYFSEYCRSSGIHCIRYLGEGGRFIIEKVIWTIIFTVVCYFCIMLILQAYTKWKSTPVIVTFAAMETPIWKIPFPAVTICPEVKADPNVFNYTDVLIRKLMHKNISIDQQRYLDSLSLICDDLFDLNYTHLRIDAPTVNNLTELAYYFNSNTSTLTWLTDEYKVDDLLTEIYTSEGICFSFNMLDPDEILADREEYITKLSKNNTQSRQWSLEDGYPIGEKIDAFPFRTFLAGVKGGLEFEMFTNDSHLDYLCRGSLQGFKVTLHNPAQLPNMDQHFRVPLDQAVLVAIKPRMISVSKALKNYKPEDRQCYFANEKQLAFFKSYTQPNCLDECLSNYTLRECGCVAFYMPKSDASPICGGGSRECLENSEIEYMLSQDTHNLEKSVGECGCLPSCTSLEYDIEISQTDWNWRETFNIFSRVYDKFKKEFYDYDQAHYSRLNVYYRDMQFLTSERHELYGSLEFFANTGGLLGLLIGFSVMSAIEILYFLTLRIACNVKKFGRKYWSGEPNMMNEELNLKNQPE